MMTSNSFFQRLDQEIVDHFHEEFGRLTHEFGFTPEFWGDITRNRNRNCNAESFDREWIEGIQHEYWRRAKIVERYGWEKMCPDLSHMTTHTNLFKRVEEVTLMEESEFWLAKRCKQLEDVKKDCKINPHCISFSIDDTFELATRVVVHLDNKPQKIYKQVQSIMYRGKTLVSLRFTAAGSETLKEDTMKWVQQELLSRPIPSSEKQNVGYIGLTTDDCCKHRAFYLRIFGAGLNLKLDWMHGIKRVLKELGFLRFKGNHKELREVRDNLRFCGFPPGHRVRGGRARTLNSETIEINLSN